MRWQSWWNERGCSPWGGRFGTAHRSRFLIVKKHFENVWKVLGRQAMKIRLGVLIVGDPVRSVVIVPDSGSTYYSSWGHASTSESIKNSSELQVYVYRPKQRHSSQGSRWAWTLRRQSLAVRWCQVKTDIAVEITVDDCKQKKRLGTDIFPYIDQKSGGKGHVQEIWLHGITQVSGRVQPFICDLNDAASRIDRFN